MVQPPGAVRPESVGYFLKAGAVRYRLLGICRIDGKREGLSDAGPFEHRAEHVITS